MDPRDQHSKMKYAYKAATQENNSADLRSTNKNQSDDDNSSPTTPFSDQERNSTIYPQHEDLVNVQYTEKKSEVSDGWSPDTPLTALEQKERRWRYFQEFRAKLRRDGYQWGENCYAYLEPRPIHVVLHAEITDATGQNVLSDFDIFRIPFTHGYMKRAYLLFGLFGYKVARLHQFLVQLEDVRTVLIEDDLLSDERGLGLAPPAAAELIPLIATQQSSPEVPQNMAPPEGVSARQVAHVPPSSSCCCWRWFSY